MSLSSRDGVLNEPDVSIHRSGLPAKPSGEVNAVPNSSSSSSDDSSPSRPHSNGLTHSKAASSSSVTATFGAVSRLSSALEMFRMKSDEEIRQLFVIPHYLRLEMLAAIQSKGAAYAGSATAPAIAASVPPYPLVVMINSRSGGRLGPALRSRLAYFLTEEQVYDLSVIRPEYFVRHALGCLEKLAESGDKCAGEVREKLRILVAGGDGTVGWILGTLNELHLKQRVPVPPVGIIPLGTGNDLSRSFGWGGSFSYARRSAVRKYLLKAGGSQIQQLDSWKVIVRTIAGLHIDLPHALQPQQHVPIPSVNELAEDIAVAASFEGVFYNYFSIGMDAQVAYGFHHLRNKAPYLARGPISNKVIYSCHSCTQGWFCTPCSTSPRARGLSKMMHLHVRKLKNGDWESIEIPTNVRAVLVLNLQSYASGRNPWGHPSQQYNEKKGFMEPKANDGMLEVLGFFHGWHTAFIMIDLLKAKRLAQASAVRFELRGGRRDRAYMQMDGEPWRQPLTSNGGTETVIEIECMVYPVLMLSAS